MYIMSALSYGPAGKGRSVSMAYGANERLEIPAVKQINRLVHTYLEETSNEGLR